MKKRIISVTICILLLIGMFPMSAFSAEAVGDPVELTEGAYAPNQVVVLFKNSAIDTDTVPKKGELASVGANHGEMMDASSSALEAYSAADEESDILSKSLGADFVLEDTLVFADALDHEEYLPALGASAEPVSKDELTVALVSSDKYDTATMIELLGKNKNVVQAEPNYYVYPTSLDDYSLNDPCNSFLYNLNSPAAVNTGGEQVNDRGASAEEALSVNASSGWKKLTGDEDEVVVAVIDTGVLAEHEDLRDMMWTNPGNIGLKGEHGYDFFNNSGDTTDDNGHGTHCAGTIAAQANNLKGVAGVASKANVKIMALKLLGGDGTSGEEVSTVYQAIGCFNYIHKAVAGGVNVVAANNSWGSGGQSTIFDEVISVLCDDGVICYAAAGNYYDDNDRTQFSPCNSECDNIVAVGAADITGLPTEFTNYGKTSVDVFGPGMNILSAVSDDNYFPMIYDAERFNATTAYYGEFNAETVVADGTVTPSVGSKSGGDVSAFGSLQFVKRRTLDDDDDYEIPDDATLELSVESGRHFNPDNPYRLKITVKNAQYGESYFIFFPYERTRVTNGDDNTWVAIDAESIASSDGSSAVFFSGEIYRKDDGNMAVAGEVPLAGITEKAYDRMEMHASCKGSELFGTEDFGDKETSLGLCLVTQYQEGEAHDASVYLDSLAVSRPDFVLEPGTSYDLMSGTSQATPAVCGAGTLLAALYPRQDGEAGADYVRRIRSKLFACVRKTDVLADLCSTGGYVDLSLLDSAVPSVSDALCDMENESIKLIGENLFEGSTLTYKRLAVDGAGEEALPDDMPVEYAADGSGLIIHNAKRLFSTYTAFTVTSPNGMKGTGKFFLVKGQNRLTVIDSYRQANDWGRVDVPSLLTDSDGKSLYGYYPKTGEICRYDGEQFVTLRDTRLRDALRDYLMENGTDTYSVYNDNSITFFTPDSPICENDVVYMAMVDYVLEEASGGEEEEPVFRKDCYLASFDLNSDDHHWQFTGMTIPPDVFWEDDALNMTLTMFNGKLVCIGDSVLIGENDSSLPMYSYDLETKEWTKEPDLPYVADCFDCVQHNGRLYAMFGCDPDTSLSNEERILHDVWRFDGEKWEKANDDLRYVGRVNDNQGILLHPDAIAAVKNGFVFVGPSVDGGGNVFLYRTDTDSVEPLYYTPSDTIRDATEKQSCVATRDGIYYICRNDGENHNGWDLCLLPVSAGAYESPFEDHIPGDLNLDGRVDIRDATAIQKHLAGLITLEGDALSAADTDGSGAVDINDVTHLQKYIAKYDVALGKQPA